jgi:response regulator RpfG family c-di-GMP phosphodiesterase
VINPLAENRRILIVDDNDAIHHDFMKILCNGSEACDLAVQEAALFGDAAPAAPVPQFDLASATQGRDAVVMVAEALHEESPFALAFVDMRMPPGWDGLVTIQHMWEVDPRLHVVICTAYTDYTSGQILQELGQTDRLLILKKPFEPDEVRLAAVTMTKKWQQAMLAQQQTEGLEREVARQTHHVHQTRDAMMFALAQLAESRDTETGQHLDRMREYSQILARQLSEDGPYTDQIDTQFLGDLYRSSPLHDIGKVGIPDSILLKPGPLTADEYSIMKQHVAIGTSTIRGAIDRLDESSLQMAADVVEFHHERFDGSGYLKGLKGQEIPLAARIVALADVFDAISSKRIYKDAIDPKRTREIILDERGKHFDPAVVDAFLACDDQFLQVAGVAHQPASPLLEV